MTQWPRYAAFKSQTNGKYLSLIPELGKSLRLSGNKVHSPFTRFELEKPHRENLQNYVNIRSCYSNKYWSMTSASDATIVSSTAKPVEDPSVWSSTLFELVQEEGTNTAEILLHYDNLIQCVAESDVNGEFLFIYIKPGEKDGTVSSAVFEIIDLEKNIMLPKYVAFKGNNQMFLKTHEYNNHPHLQFSGSDIYDPSVAFEVVTDADGRIQIKSTHTGKFWELNESDKWILANKDNPSSENSWFMSESLENDLIVLRSQKNKLFCRRFTTDATDEENFLCANSEKRNEECTLMVVELVKSRRIDNVRFHSENARMYNQRKMTMVSKKIINKSVDGLTTKQSIVAEKIRMTTWSTTTSWKVGGSASLTIKFGDIVSGEFQISGEYGEAKQEGGANTTRDMVTSEETFQVPKGKMVIISMVGTKAFMDIPFSYSQRDTLMNRDIVPYDNKHDGVYTCLDMFDIAFVAEMEDLSPEEKETHG